MKKGMGLFLICGFLIASYPLSSQDTECAEGQLWVNGACGDASIAALESGWNEILPGGDTVCAHGDPYRYWVRPGTSEDLLLFFQGGGGCWNADTCRQGSTWYKQTVQEFEIFSYGAGIFDFDNPENPFTDYTMVFAPVCTGDVHTGNRVTDYGDGVIVNHTGFVNTSAALSWAYENIENPSSIFMTGCSAGSVGSIFHAPYVIDHYTDAPVYQLGDSLSFVFPEAVNLDEDWGMENNLPDWIPGLEGMASSFTSAAFYSTIANFYPTYRFGQYNSQYDNVQRRYFTPGASSTREDWRIAFETSINTIQANTDNFYSYTAGGDLHCITPRSQFYTYRIGDVRVNDWFGSFATGETIETLHCEDCDQPETVGDEE